MMALSTVASQEKDCLCVLPTGYGKSLIYQLLPFVFDGLQPEGKSDSCVIVVSPLNAIMEDQICKLSPDYNAVTLRRHSPKAGLTGTTTNAKIDTCKLLFGHAECFVDDNSVKKLLTDVKLKSRVSAVVVDEAHFIIQWKEFRPAYADLSALASLFPHAPILALTATANNAYRREIIDSLGMKDPTIIERNPDRANIYFSVKQRPSTGEEKIIEPIKDLAAELKAKKIDMPRTIVYGNLAVCGECFSFFQSFLGEKQYFPLGSTPIFDNRLFAQYHAQYPTKYKDALVDSLVTGASKARVIFVTVAFGVGVDCRDVERVIHIGVPSTMEEFFQEVGRAGRNGTHSLSCLYYNGHDISKGRKAMTQVMREYVSTSLCRRKIIMEHFDRSVPQYWNDMHMHHCCDNCASSCQCDNCVCNRQFDNLTASLSESQISESDPPIVSTGSSVGLDDLTSQQLRSDLLGFRMSLSPESTSVGISLTTGFSVELIDIVQRDFIQINSLEDVLDQLPLFSNRHGEEIWKIICKYKKK